MAIERQTSEKVSTESSLLGVGGNPGYIIDSYQMKGPDGYLVYDNAGSLDYLGGEAIKADGPGKKIVETQWFKSGTLRDSMLLSLVFWQSTLDGGTVIPSNVNILNGYIYKRNPKTQEIVKTTPINYVNKGLSGDIGVTPRGSDFNYMATQWLQFDPKYEYKIELSTVHTLEPNQSVLVDYMYLQFGNRTAWYEQEQFAFGSSTYGYGESINVMVNARFSIATDGSGNGSTNITQMKLGDTLGYNNCAYLMNDISNIIPVMFDTNSDGSMGLEVYWAASTTGQGGYLVRIDVQNGFANSTLYGTVTIIGSFSPPAV
jgi:hypothetical protein